ncbi:ribonuclease H-like domain-containing protein [Candidatus Micrarchaeota archaeon]|nr:ribonuclease H-like domain-containing protein [Candidatus Micrarchaeota archaeon]
MLEHTFIHLPNFGPKREQKLWSCGIRTWDDFLSHFGNSPYHRDWCRRIASSKYALKSRDAVYFANHLPNDEMWRSFPHFNKIAYLDIETTGLSAEQNDITVIGLFDGSKTHSYIHGQNLNAFYKEIAKYEAVVTFNGSLFDIPFIKKSMKGIKVPALHIDLRFLLSSLGVTGGLKKIEKQFNLEREDDLNGLTGYDAVLLWKAYTKKKDKDALDKLVRYNAADVSNLKILIEWAYKEKRLRTGIAEFIKN